MIGERMAETFLRKSCCKGVLFIPHDFFVCERCLFELNLFSHHPGASIISTVPCCVLSNPDNIS